MLVIPAIDLYGGKVVRLLRGDPNHSTIYSEDPIAIAKQWKDQGAKLIHLVDLSAAFGQGDNLEIIERILKEVNVSLEIGGGLRDLKKAQHLIELGAQRVIIGTKGTDEAFLAGLIKAIGSEKIAVGVDVIDSRVAVMGWQEKSQWQTLDFIRYLGDKGIKWVIYTDISRDGTLEGPNLEEVKQFFKFSSINFILSGGISCLDDIKKIKEELPYVKGVIVGKALYEGKFQLSEAIGSF
jgi:phosphoribosylformimino-5-aminoimidazole carboxamide ribotide isomerase